MTQDVATRSAGAHVLRLSKLLVLPAVALLALLISNGGPKPAEALFHLSVIDEAMFGANGDPNVQFVEVMELAGGQNLVSHSLLSVFDASGTLVGTPYEVPSTVPGGAVGARWVMGTSAYAAISGMTPDFIFPPFAMPATGMICWGAPGILPPNPSSSWDHTNPLNYVDCIPYNGYSAGNIRFPPATTLGLGDGSTQSLTRTGHTNNTLADFALACPSPTNNYGGVGMNHDNHVDLPVTRLFDDLTWPNSDLVGDNCGDTDKDNDGLPDATETGGPPCASATGPTDPLKADTDGDRALDGAECALGTDPVNPLSKPLAAPPGDTDHDGLTDAFEISIGSDPTKPDTDGDKLLDSTEVLYYNSSPTSTNTDGDLCTDGKEAASLNADNTVNSSDQLIVAQAFGPSTGPKYFFDFDINRDGNINSGDMLLTAKTFGACP